MTGLPRDSTERTKLELLSEFHRQLLSCLSSEDTCVGLTIPEALYTYYPELPRHAVLGKTLAETVIEKWIDPKAREKLRKLDPRKIRTATQARNLQGVLAYYYTYVQEHLSAGQLVDAKLHDAQAICDVWCQITETKRFVVNKLIESLLVVKSPRTVQRYVAQGMAVTFGLTFGSARLGKKPAPPPTRTESIRGDASASDVANPISDQAGSGRLLQTDAAKSMAEFMPSSLDGDKLDQYLSTLADVHKTPTSVATFTELARFALRVPEAAYSHSRYFGPFIHDLSQFEPDSVEERLDIVELRSQLRTHPVVKQVLAERHLQQMQTTRDDELEIVQHLCDTLLQRRHRTHNEVHAWIARLCGLVVGRPEDADFTVPVARMFDHLAETDQVVLVAKLLEDCRTYAFDFAVLLVARSSGAFVRSRVRYLVRTSRGCQEHLAHAQDRLMHHLDRIGKSGTASSELRREVYFLERYLQASGFAIDSQMEMAIRKYVGQAECSGD